MKEQLLLLLRVSKPEYNRTLYEDYKLYMNNQFSYKKTGLTKGQFDTKEGMVAGEGVRLLYSVDDRKTWTELHGIQAMHNNNNAYIYCMYGIKYDPAQYDARTNTYYHFIPWEYFKDFWQDDSLEMMVIKNTAVFIDSFKKAACSENMSYAYGKVKYDLDERMEDVSYFDDAIKDSFESVFHKTKIPYEIQNEIRFSVIDSDNPPFLELQLNKTNTLFFDILPMIKGKGVMIKLTDLEFGEDNSLPVRFSSKIQYYVPEENNGDT